MAGIDSHPENYSRFNIFHLKMKFDKNLGVKCRASLVH